MDRNYDAASGAVWCVPSPPSRRRGSKRRLPINCFTAPGVASLTEAWIETSAGPVSPRAMMRRLPHGGVDRNALKRVSVDGVRPGRLPHGGVDRNVVEGIGVFGRVGRLPRGGVDRNSLIRYIMVHHSLSPPSRRRGSKLNVICPLLRPPRRLPHGGVDRNVGWPIFWRRPSMSPPSRRRGFKHL